MAYTLGEAAKATGRSKSTLSKAIKNGKISASKGENGAFDIDPSELHRVYPPVSANSADTVANGTPDNTAETLRLKELEVLLKAAEDRLRDKEELVSELRDERDRWCHQANALLEDNRRAFALLEDERKRPSGRNEEPSSSGARKGFLRRLVGRANTR